MQNVPLNIGALLTQVREKNGIVHQITNNVTINDCANVTLAIGASPIMADECGEVAEIVALASALVINMGTLHNASIQAMLLAGKTANALGIPVVIDPVGLGASRLRNDTLHLLLDALTPQIIRGNMSEIAFLAGIGQKSKGVDVSREDETHMMAQGAHIAQACAAKLGCTISMTGKTDFISNGTQTVCIENGTSMLGKVTGTGCMCTALTGCFYTPLTVCPQHSLLAAAGAVATMGICGELAFETAGAKGTGSFNTALIDAFSTLTPQQIQNRIHMREV